MPSNQLRCLSINQGAFQSINVTCNQYRWILINKDAWQSRCLLINSDARQSIKMPANQSRCLPINQGACQSTKVRANQSRCVPINQGACQSIKVPANQSRCMSIKLKKLLSRRITRPRYKSIRLLPVLVSQPWKPTTQQRHHYMCVLIFASCYNSRCLVKIGQFYKQCACNDRLIRLWKV